MQATATYLTILGERANEPRVKQNEPRLLDHIRTVQELLGPQGRADHDGVYTRVEAGRKRCTWSD